MDLSSDSAAARQGITDALVANTRAVTRLSGQDVDFHRSLRAEFAASLDDCNARLLKLTEKLLKRANPSAAVKAPALPNEDAVDASWPRILDIADSLFERADTCLDEYTGLIKRRENGERAQSSSPRPRKGRLGHALRDAEISKPQLLFETKPTNNEANPFRPFLSTKPHSLTPFNQSFETVTSEDGSLQYQHPYRDEISRYQFPSAVYSAALPIDYLPFDTTQATYVDSLEGLHLMLHELKEAREIAVDLEHHDTHSYIGIVSLMQISTRNRDWIVDTLKPWRRKLAILNEVFSNPNIVKVLHGAHMDIVWLQRDLGLYIVGLFDTYHAARVLGYPGGSLAYLLKRFVNFDAQKQYQTADWRIRPLPSELLDYARSDTHFLLYIYDHLRNELVQRSDFRNTHDDRVNEVLLRSKDECLQRYEHPIYDAQVGGRRNGWSGLLTKYPSDLTKSQISVFAKAHQWRDVVARNEDESVNTVMQNHVLYNIARMMPVDKASLLAVSHPISGAVRQRADELLEVIQNAQLDCDTMPTMVEVLTVHHEKRVARKLSDMPQIAHMKPDTDFAKEAMNVQDNDMRASRSSFWGVTLNTKLSDKTEIGSAGTGSYNITLPLVDPPIPYKHRNHVEKSRDNESEPPLYTFRDQFQVPSNRTLEGQPQVSDPCQVMPEADADESALQRVQQRAERKANKLARRDAKKSSHGESIDDAEALHGAEGDVAPSNSSSGASASTFDYATAPSVLHARSHERQKTGSKTAVNPYARAEEAPSGLKRKQHFTAGRSKTFK